MEGFKLSLLLWVGMGSFLGGVVRFLVFQYVQTIGARSFPWGTMAVNMLGSLMVGFLLALAEKRLVQEEMRFFLMVGLLGGFTTFSAFSAETYLMLSRGEFAKACLYVGLSMVLGPALALAGYRLMSS
ncbi:MAG: fluoride efflux transporter CrcB [Leptospiraceae bacterium]|nr:fluoride efflux transporter CrcB [Leptospiraceae bacterium]MDW8307265.1 fluoride efflux transporter CrcB [Leptospiraceae bacterium]